MMHTPEFVDLPIPDHSTNFAFFQHSPRCLPLYGQRFNPLSPSPPQMAYSPLYRLFAVLVCTPSDSSVVFFDATSLHSWTNRNPIKSSEIRYRLRLPSASRGSGSGSGPGSGPGDTITYIKFFKSGGEYFLVGTRTKVLIFTTGDIPSLSCESILPDRIPRRGDRGGVASASASGSVSGRIEIPSPFPLRRAQYDEHSGALLLDMHSRIMVFKVPNFVNEVEGPDRGLSWVCLNQFGFQKSEFSAAGISRVDGTSVHVLNPNWKTSIVFKLEDSLSVMPKTVKNLTFVAKDWVVFTCRTRIVYPATEDDPEEYVAEASRVILIDIRTRKAYGIPEELLLCQEDTDAVELEIPRERKLWMYRLAWEPELVFLASTRTTPKCLLMLDLSSQDRAPKVVVVEDRKDFVLPAADADVFLTGCVVDTSVGPNELRIPDQSKNDPEFFHPPHPVVFMLDSVGCIHSASLLSLRVNRDKPYPKMLHEASRNLGRQWDEATKLASREEPMLERKARARAMVEAEAEVGPPVPVSADTVPVGAVEEPAQNVPRDSLGWPQESFPEHDAIPVLPQHQVTETPMPTVPETTPRPTTQAPPIGTAGEMPIPGMDPGVSFLGSTQAQWKNLDQSSFGGYDLPANLGDSVPHQVIPQLPTDVPLPFYDTPAVSTGANLASVRPEGVVPSNSALDSAQGSRFGAAVDDENEEDDDSTDIAGDEEEGSEEEEGEEEGEEDQPVIRRPRRGPHRAGRSQAEVAVMKGKRILLRMLRLQNATSRLIGGFFDTMGTFKKSLFELQADLALFEDAPLFDDLVSQVERMHEDAKNAKSQNALLSDRLEAAKADKDKLQQDLDLFNKGQSNQRLMSLLYPLSAAQASLQKRLTVSHDAVVGNLRVLDRLLRKRRPGKKRRPMLGPDGDDSDRKSSDGLLSDADYEQILRIRDRINRGQRAEAERLIRKSVDSILHLLQDPGQFAGRGKVFQNCAVYEKIARLRRLARNPGSQALKEAARVATSSFEDVDRMHALYKDVFDMVSSASEFVPRLLQQHEQLAQERAFLHRNRDQDRNRKSTWGRRRKVLRSGGLFSHERRSCRRTRTQLLSRTSKRDRILRLYRGPLAKSDVYVVPEVRAMVRRLVDVEPFEIDLETRLAYEDPLCRAIVHLRESVPSERFADFRQQFVNLYAKLTDGGGRRSIPVYQGSQEQEQFPASSSAPQQPQPKEDDEEEEEGGGGGGEEEEMAGVGEVSFLRRLALIAGFDPNIVPADLPLDYYRQSRDKLSGMIPPALMPLCPRLWVEAVRILRVLGASDSRIRLLRWKFSTESFKGLVSKFEKKFKNVRARANQAMLAEPTDFTKCDTSESPADGSSSGVPIAHSPAVEPEPAAPAEIPGLNPQQPTSVGATRLLDRADAVQSEQETLGTQSSEFVWSHTSSEAQPPFAPSSPKVSLTSGTVLVAATTDSPAVSAAATSSTPDGPRSTNETTAPATTETTATPAATTTKINTTPETATATPAATTTEINASPEAATETPIAVASVPSASASQPAVAIPTTTTVIAKADDWSALGMSGKEGQAGFDAGQSSWPEGRGSGTLTGLNYDDDRMDVEFSGESEVASASWKDSLAAFGGGDIRVNDGDGFSGMAQGGAAAEAWGMRPGASENFVPDTQPPPEEREAGWGTLQSWGGPGPQGGGGGQGTQPNTRFGFDGPPDVPDATWHEMRGN